MAETLVALARDRTRAAALGRAGRLRQQRSFSLETMLCGYADLLGDVSRTPRRRGLLTLAEGT
jgi:hypothetical protein